MKALLAFGAGRSVAKTNLWTIGASEQFCTDCPQLTSENHDDRGANAKRPDFQFNFPQDVLKPESSYRQRYGKHMRFQVASLLLKSAGNLCPVCGAETALTEIEPHPRTPSLRFTDTSVTRAGPSNPWSCFVCRAFNRRTHASRTFWRDSK